MDNPVDTSGNPLPVRIVDIDVSLDSLIVLLFKLAVAGIPVGIVVALAWWLISSGLHWLV